MDVLRKRNAKLLLMMEALVTRSYFQDKRRRKSVNEHFVYRYLIRARFEDVRDAHDCDGQAFTAVIGKRQSATRLHKTSLLILAIEHPHEMCLSHYNKTSSNKLIFDLRKRKILSYFEGAIDHI